MPDQPRLPGVDWHEGDFPRSRWVAAHAKRYTEQQGLPFTTPNVSAVRADPGNLVDLGVAVKTQQGRPGHISKQFSDSYASLVKHVDKQYDYMTKPRSEGGMGLTSQAHPADPYSTPEEMTKDVKRHKRVDVLAADPATGGETTTHTVLTREQNEKFRAVHDLFGHAATGRNFSRHGEEAANQFHGQMFPPSAHRALYSELRAQNASLIYSGTFPEDKPYNIPQRFNTPQVQPPKTKSPPRQGVQQRMF